MGGSKGFKEIGGVEMDQILQLVLNNGGAKTVGAAKMDQILQLVPNNGGQRGRRGRNGSNSPIGAEQWGVKGSEGSKWIKFSNWC